MHAGFCAGLFHHRHITVSIRDKNKLLKTFLTLVEIIEVRKPFIYMELENYLKKMKNIFFITYLEVCKNNMILIFTLVKSKSSQNRLNLNQNHSNQNDFISKSEIPILIIKIMPISVYMFINRY